MTQEQLPSEFDTVRNFAVKCMLWLNGFAHLVIGLALAASVLMFTWLFFVDVKDAAYSHNLVHGFLHALGTLMLLWSISALISAEIRYLRGSKLLVETFIEVVLVLFLRKLIVLPVQDVSPTLEEVGMWVGGSFFIGIIYVLLRWGQKEPAETTNNP